MLSDFEKNNHCIAIPPDWDLPKYPPQARVRIVDFRGDEHWGTVVGLEWNCDDPGSPARKEVEKGMHYIIRFDPGNSLYTSEDTLTVYEDEIMGLAPEMPLMT